jgi:iron complex outermembrane receptor protein
VGSILSNDPVTGGALTRSVAGNDLPNAPSLAVSAGMEYPVDLGSGELTLRIDGKYSSSYYFDVFNDADTRQKAYATGNLSATYRTGPYTIQAFVRNFTDKVVFANAHRRIQQLSVPAAADLRRSPRLRLLGRPMTRRAGFKGGTSR